MQLDGETNLKDKQAPVETSVINETMIYRIRGDMSCDAPDANLEHWEADVSFPLPGLETNQELHCDIKSLCLRGTVLKNTEYCFGIVVYTGPETKIMMNAKAPPTKISNVQRMMNTMLYSVFLFQLALITLYAFLSYNWFQAHENHNYIGKVDF